MIQSDQKQHSLGVVDGGTETVLAVVLGVAVLLVAAVVVVVAGLLGVGVQGVVLDMQTLKCFSTEPSGAHISQ